MMGNKLYKNNARKTPIVGYAKGHRPHLKGIKVRDEMRKRMVAESTKKPKDTYTSSVRRPGFWEYFLLLMLTVLSFILYEVTNYNGWLQ